MGTLTRNKRILWCRKQDTTECKTIKFHIKANRMYTEFENTCSGMNLCEGAVYSA